MSLKMKINLSTLQENVCQKRVFSQHKMQKAPAPKLCKVFVLFSCLLFHAMLQVRVKRRVCTRAGRGVGKGGGGVCCRWHVLWYGGRVGEVVGRGKGGEGVCRKGVQGMGKDSR